MNSIISNILGAVLIFALSVVVILGIMSVISYGKSVDSQARRDCAQISKYEVRDGKATVSYPVKDVYEDCLEEKGLR